MAPKTYLFETETCSRCGGSGRYSYCQMYGTTCFKCAGTGVALTKRGAIAQARYRDALATDALSVKVGDRVKITDSLTNKVTTITIAEIIERAPMKGASLKDGVMVPHVTRTVDLVSTGGLKFGFGGAVPLTRVPSAEERAALVADCLAYQATLTKAGTVRKGKAKVMVDANDDDWHPIDYTDN